VPESAAPAPAVPFNLEAANRDLAQAGALDIVRAAAKAFGDGLVLTSSFGAQAAVMLHLCTRVTPDIPVIFVDTGYLFPETYTFAQELAERLTLNLKVYQSPLSPARMEALMGRLWEEPSAEKLDRYDQVRKVEPLRRALKDLKATAWLSGVRGGQTEHRQSMNPVEWHAGYELYAVHPILRWSTRDIHNYLTEHELPYHPLYYKGYKSIGDTHSTRPINPGEDERAGRFHGLKSECGIHLPKSKAENESLGSAGL
jgi:phosphoadenosine phosphosulfate reductase